MRRLSALVALLLPSFVHAGPIGPTARSFEPYSRTAQAITGPIILSNSRIIFASGAMTDIEEVASDIRGAWDFSTSDVAAQVFRILDDPGEVLNGNSICGDPVRFVAVSQTESFGSWTLTLAYFTGDQQPTSIDSAGMCATYGYVLDGPLASTEPTPDGALAPSSPSGVLAPPDDDDRTLIPTVPEFEEATGTLTLSPTRLTFPSGGYFELQPIPDPPRWAAGLGDLPPTRFYTLTGDPGPMVSGEPICAGERPGFLAASERGGPNGQWIGLDFYTSDPRDAFYPTDAERCTNFTYNTTALPDDGGAFGPAPEPEDDGSWHVTFDTNPIDDTATVVLSLQAHEGRSSMGEPLVFVARCQSNTTEAYIVWNDYLGDDSSRGRNIKYVTVRIGDEPATDEQWGVSTDSQATFAPGWAGDLLKRMLAADQLVVRTTPYNENPVTAVFDTTGLRVVLRKLADTCHWTY